MTKNQKKYYSMLLLSAVTGATLLASGHEVRAELIDGVNKEIICKRPKQNERQLKLHSCQTMQYPLAPLQQLPVEPAPIPDPPYSS